MVTLFCVIVGEKGSAFGVEIDANEFVGDLKDAIKRENERTITCDADNLQLYLGKKSDGTWLDRDGAEAVTLDGNGYLKGFMHMDPLLWIKNPKNFGEHFEPNEGEIHVLVVVPENDQEQWDEARARKKARTRATIEVERMNSIADTLDIDRWQIGGIELNIHHIEPDFPKRFYVRKETQDIIKIFLELKLSIAFVGSPGVGKSMLVVLFAFYKALRQEKVVVLLRNQKAQGLSMLYLDGKNKVYWRKNKAKLYELGDLLDQDVELCLDGFMQTDITNIQNCGNLESFRLLATSGQYDLKNNEYFGRRTCLVPFWSKSDLNKIGSDMLWTKSIIYEQYYYSGGNLRDFLLGTTTSRFAINQAVAVACMHTAELLSTQYTFVSASQVDCLRMTTIQSHGQTIDLRKYLNCGEWLCVITSEYVLRKLGHIVTPSYYEDVWSKSCMLGDNALMGIAFKNYVHTMAKDGQMLKLQMRKYDRKEKQKEHTYSTLEFRAKSCCNSGNDTAECKTIMQDLANIDVDYWYPYTRSLETIDCVAKLNMGGEHKEVGLIQIAKSDNHKIDSEALDRYATMFPDSVRYIALVPNKESCDKLRLFPANPPTKVPLHVAYVTDWRL